MSRCSCRWPQSLCLWMLPALVLGVGATSFGDTNLALNKPAVASSTYSQDYAASLAVDGNAGTRWSSVFYANNAWIYVDLQATCAVNGVKLSWNPAYGREYQIQVSSDATNWTTVQSVTDGDGGVDELSFSLTYGRYVRMNGTAGDSTYGYSLWEFEVNGSADATVPGTVSNLATGTATPSSLTLTWTAPGDDGSTGTAAAYDIRYSTSAISAGNWASATQVSGEPTPAAAGTSQSMTVGSLSASTTYYFAIKTSDEVPNTSAISNSPSGQTLALDSTAPGAVSDLTTSSPTNSSLTLTWTAPGDDGSTGTATSYDIRYATSPINAGNWASATPVSGEPTPAAAGTGQNMTVSGLSASTIYYFAIKTADETPNWSALSNGCAGSTIGGTNGATFVSQSVPTSMIAGQNYTVSVTMHNSGTNPWTAAAEHNLGSQNPNDNYTWGMHRVLLAADEAVAPGQDKTFSWTVTAPASAGTYNFQWKMVREWVEWFGPLSTNVAVTVSTGDTNLALNKPAVASSVYQTYTASLAVDGNPNTRWSSVFTASEWIYVDLQATYSVNRVKLSWDPAYGVEYQIQVSNNATDWTTAYSVTNGDGGIDDLSFAPASGRYVRMNGTVRGSIYGYSLWDFEVYGGGDTAAPAAVSDLATSNVTNSSMTLTWTAPGDDDSAGTATSYDIRYASSPINAGNWASATPVSGEPTPAVAGTSQSMVVSGLSAHTIYYFAIKTSDAVPNTSAISNSPVGSTTGGTNDATFVSQNVPTSMVAGQPYTVSVTMHNSGTNPWTAAAEQKLGSQNSQDNFTWNMHRVLLAAGDAIAPGQDKVFSWTITAPATPGTYNFQWKMVQEWIEWFGDLSTNLVVTVSSSGGGDTTAPAAVSDLVASNATSNSLTLTWTAPGDDGAAGTAATYDIRYATSAITETNWASATQVSGEPTPAAAGTVQSKVVSGLSAHTIYYFAIKTADEVPNWSGLSYKSCGSTTGGTNGATFVSQSVPTSMIVGQAYTVSVTMHNSGTSSWSEAAMQRLGSQNTENNTVWGMHRVLVGSDEAVAPGQDKTFTWIVTAPASSGTYNFQWKMVQENIEWFGPFTTNVAVTVSSGGGDATAPAAVANLATGTATSSTITLTWTAPGDDGSTGTAASYDIRYRTGGAVNDSNWASATQVSSEPIPAAAGTNQSMTVSGLSASTTYYFAIKASDEVPNTSAISNSPSGATSAAGSSTIIALKRNAGLQRGWEDARFAGASVTTTTVQDALMYIVQQSRWYNGGTASASSGGGELGFYKFSLASIPACARINLAQLRIYHNNDNAAPAPASMVLTHDWLEGTTNWTFPGAAGGLTWWAPMAYNTDIYQNPAGGSSEPYGGWGLNSDSAFDVSVDAGLPVYPSTGGTWGWGGHVWDVTSHVQTWVRSGYPNFGWVLGPQGQNFNFSEAGTDYQPVLFIDYTLTGDMTPPATVANLATSNVTNSSITLNWTAPGDDNSTGTAASYSIRYSKSSITASNWVLATPIAGVPAPQTAGTGQSVVLSGLPGNTTYYFAMKTSDEVPNTSGLSNVVSAQTSADTVAPAAVSNLATSSPTNHSLTLTWTAPGDDNSTGTAASHDIRYSTSTINAGNWASATQVTNEPVPAAAGTGQSLLIDNLTQNTTYYFAMKTSDEVPNTSGLSNVASGPTLADTTAPGAVTSLAVAKTKSSTLKLTWIASGDDGATGTATSYDIRYRTGGAVTEGNWASCTQVTGEPVPTQPGYHHSLWITGLSASTTYYVGIKALDEVSNASSLATVSAATPAASNLTRPLLQPSDFEYLGAFKMPQYACGQTTGFTSAGMAMRRVNGNLQFLAESGFSTGSTIYECNFPGWGADSSTWPQATVVHEWGSAVYGNPSCMTDPVDLVYGLNYDQATGRLYYSYASGYNCAQENLPSLGCAVLDGGPVVSGPWSAPLPVHTQVMRGGSITIPDWFADTYLAGRKLGVGFGGGWSGWASCSPGPTLAAAHHPTGSAQLDTIPLLQYDQTDVSHWATRDANYWIDGNVYNLHSPVGDIGYWVSMDAVGSSCAWIDLADKQGLLYLCSIGQGREWYNDGKEGIDWAQPQWWVYDPADLADVAQGTKQCWQPQHDSWIMPTGASSCVFDAQTRTLFVLTNKFYNNGGVENYPVVHGYHVR